MYVNVLFYEFVYMYAYAYECNGSHLSTCSEYMNVRKCKYMYVNVAVYICAHATRARRALNVFYMHTNVNLRKCG